MLVFSSREGDVNLPFLNSKGIGQPNVLGNATLAPIAASSLSSTGPINESVTDALTAGTTHTLVGATKLTGQINVISVCASASDAVALPLANAAQVGNTVVVINNGVAAAAVWPQAADKIDNGSAGVAVTLTNAKRAMFFCNSAGDWQSMQGGVSA